MATKKYLIDDTHKSICETGEGVIFGKMVFKIKSHYDYMDILYILLTESQLSRYFNEKRIFAITDEKIKSASKQFPNSVTNDN